MTEFPLASISGISAATIVIVALFKARLATTVYLRELPLWVYVGIVATGLTLLARYGLGTLTGDPLDLCWQAASSAVMAIGFREWMLAALKPAKDSSAGQPDHAPHEQAG